MIGPAPGAPVLALAVDRIIGDPAGLWRRVPHPVSLMGWLIGWADAALNDPSLSFAQRRTRGVLVMAFLVLAAAMAAVVLRLALAHLRFGWALEALLASTLLAQNSLVRHVRAVADALGRRGIEGGREEVAKIVGRDVSVLDEYGVARAAIESAAENFSDGVVAPVFWYALLGLPGLVAFKMASTADSMIGHRSPRHEAFGWAAARLDDLLNLIPARLSALLIAGAALPAGGDAGNAFASAWRDARLHKSPNAGWPEAAAAGALGLALGGPRRYGEASVDGTWLNPAGRADATAADIRRTTRLIDAAWFILMLLLVLSALVLGR